MLHWHRTVNASLNRFDKHSRSWMCMQLFTLQLCVVKLFQIATLHTVFLWFSQNLGTHDLCANTPKNCWNRFSKIALKFVGEFFKILNLQEATWVHRPPLVYDILSLTRGRHCSGLVRYSILWYIFSHHGDSAADLANFTLSECSWQLSSHRYQLCWWRSPFYWWSNEMGLRFSKFWGISSRYGSPHKLA